MSLKGGLMILINKVIIEALRPLKIPVSFQKYSGRSIEYITFHEYFQNGEEYEDDDESLTGHYVQVDVWSKGDYSNLVIQVKRLLSKKNFIRINEIDLYEEENRLYHKGLKFYYLENKEEVQDD